MSTLFAAIDNISQLIFAYITKVNVKFDYLLFYNIA
jgi:hypothetical protein